MNTLELTNRMNYSVTSIPNAFLDRYMPSANGEFVKVYLYLLRRLNDGGGVSICGIADILNHTEKDVIRALKYWEQQGLVSLNITPGRQLAGITLLSIPETDDSESIEDILLGNVSPADEHAQASMYASTSAHSEFTHKTEAYSETAATVSDTDSFDTEQTQPPKKHVYSPAELDTFKKQEDVSTLLYVAERYIGKTLSSTDTNTILYMYDELKFNAELIEYLIEYCVGNNHRSLRYMEKVAISWAEEGITSVTQAKTSTESFSNTCYPVLKAFGISGRNPGKSEKDYIVKWTNSYGFDMDIILDACNRTIQTIHQPSFDYADSILTKWRKHGVHKLEDIKKLDAEYHNNKDKKSKAPQNVSANPASNNTFNDFSQRTYDYDALEKKILANR